jgi:hypothetical protein
MPLGLCQFGAEDIVGKISKKQETGMKFRGSSRRESPWKVIGQNTYQALARMRVGPLWIG